MRSYRSTEEAFIGEVGGVGLDEFASRLTEHYAESKIMGELATIASVVDSTAAQTNRPDAPSTGFKMGGALGVLVRVGFPTPYHDSYLQTRIHRDKQLIIDTIPVDSQEPLFSKAMIHQEVLHRSEVAMQRHGDYLGALALMIANGTFSNPRRSEAIITGFGYTMWTFDSANMESFAHPDEIALIGDMIAPDEASVDQELRRILDSDN